VIQVGLASDARTVQARCAIDSEFRELVRMNSKFWNRSGWRLDVGLTGIKLDADTLSQMVSGGIEMATPADGSGTVSTGHRFELADTPDPSWAEWKPSLVYGKAWNDLETRTPQPLRIALRWQERRFGFRTNQQRAAWCLPLDDGSVLCLSNQIYASSSAITGTTVVELAGLSVSPDQLQNLSTGQTIDAPQVVQFSLDSPLPADVQRWSAKLISDELPAEVCDVYIAQMDLANFVSVDSARIKVNDKKWMISETITMTEDLNGSPVLSLQSGKVIGLLNVDSSIGTILPLR
jgi:paraquat-inducible protein B